MTQIIFNERWEELDQEAATIIEESIKEILKNKEHVVLAVPGGRSVAGIFNQLKAENIPWKKVHIFMVDERQVPITDKESNFKLAKDNFIGTLIEKKLIPEQNIHPYLVEEGIEAYEKELKELGGVYDIVLLSSGEDGHIGALYPNHHSYDDEAEFFIEMEDSPKPPPKRMSMSRNLLLKSRVVILLFYNEGKKEAYRKFINTSIEARDCPAKLAESIVESYIVTNINLDR